MEPVPVRWRDPAWIMKRLIVQHYILVFATEEAQAPHRAFLTAPPGEAMWYCRLECKHREMWAHTGQLLKPDGTGTDSIGRMENRLYILKCRSRAIKGIQDESLWKNTECSG